MQVGGVIAAIGFEPMHVGDVDYLSPKRHKVLFSKGFQTPVHMNRRQSGGVVQFLLRNRQTE